MGYLITHIAISLIFAQLLGLLLGWLLWGYIARQRGQEVQSLRERLTDMQLASHRVAIAAAPQRSLPEMAGTLIEGTLPISETVHAAAEREEFPLQAKEEPTPEAVMRASPIAPDLEAEVKAAKIQHLEQQVRELESIRERLSLLQTDLSNAISGRRAAESSLEEANHDFEVRLSSLLAQIRDFENAANAWDQMRDEFERSAIAKDKELATVRAHLRDLQNSQRPQMAEAIAPAPAAGALELADLRERHQRVVKERDALASELEFWKQNDSARSSDSAHLAGRVAGLEESLRAKDDDLREQVARIESLLWRVAELEPFAAAAPRMEEDLRRHESEIAGHMAMHTESAERLRSLQSRIAELDAETETSEKLRNAVAAQQSEIERLTENHARQLAEFQQTVAEKEASIAQHASAIDEYLKAASALQSRIREVEILLQNAAVREQSLSERVAKLQRLTQDYAGQIAEFQQLVGQKEKEIAEHAATRSEQTNRISALQTRVGELEIAEKRIATLEKTLSERETEIGGLFSAHADMQREMQGWKDYAAQLQPMVSQIPSLENLLNEREAEISRLNEVQKDQDEQLKYLQQRVDVSSARVTAHQERIQELEPLAARVPLMEQQLLEREEESRKQVQASKDLEERHQAEITRLKLNSAQRLRRLRQGITNFKG